MKKLMFLSLFSLIIAFKGFSGTFCYDMNEGLPHITREMVPQVTDEEIGKGSFEKVENVAEYGGADYSNAIGIARDITLDQAYAIALANPEITYFFFTKGCQMVLCVNDQGGMRLFHYGDVVFFKSTPWWGSADGLADGYIKRVN